MRYGLVPAVKGGSDLYLDVRREKLGDEGEDSEEDEENEWWHFSSSSRTLVSEIVID